MRSAVRESLEPIHSGVGMGVTVAGMCESIRSASMPKRARTKGKGGRREQHHGDRCRGTYKGKVMSGVRSGGKTWD